MISAHILSEVVEKIKAAVAIEDVITEDGIMLKQRGRELVGYHSNKHDSESKTSLTINPAQGLYYCFNCGEGGDVITWLIKNRGMTFIEALHHLAARAGVEMPKMDPEEQERRNEWRKEQEQLWELYTAAAKIYHSMLGERGYKLLRDKWGLTAETAKKYLFGFAPNNKKFIFQKLREQGFNEELIYRSGLVNKGGNDYFQGRLIFPYWNGGRVVYFAARRIDGVTPEEEWEKPKYKKLPLHSGDRPHISPAITNEFFVGEDTARGADELLITEGVADCYAAIQAGFACISPATVQFRKEDFPKLAMLAKRARTVYLCNDNEESEAGEKGALATAEYLEDHGINVRLVQLPRLENVDKVDLADYLKEHTAEDFRELLKQAKSLLELTLDKLSQNPEDAEARQEAIKRIARLGDIERDVCVAKLYQILKKVGVKKNTLEAAVKKAAKEESEVQKEEEKTSQADDLVFIATSEAFLFHDETRDGFAALPINGHKEVWPLGSKFFKQWLVRRYYEQTEKSPNNEAVRQALNVIEAKAVFDGPEIKLNLRVADHDGILWYDLADEAWRAVKITCDGWEVIDDPPIIFRRFKNTTAQVLPQPGGSLDLLKKYINLKDEADWRLLLALIVHAFIPGVPHAIPVFYGDKGAAKTTAQRVIRKLIDPAHRDTMTLPTDKNELALMLMTNYAPCFDNLDGLSPWQSDMLCQAATGGGISKRELYTDTDEVILSFLRSPMLNGINLVASRDDLLDRCVLFKLERIDESQRKTESEFWREFEQDRPYILGAIFDTLAGALRMYPTIRLPALPRMADFATWGYAIMEAIEPGGGEKFLQAYRKNIAGAVEEAVTSDPVGAAVVEFMTDKDEWQGTATELLEALNELPGVDGKDKAWPKRPNTLTRRLNRIKSALADYGIRVEEYRESSLSRTRFLRIRKNIVQTVQTVQRTPEALKIKDSYLDDILDDMDNTQKISSNPEALEIKALDDMDDMDDIFSASPKSDEKEIEVWEI